jgi:hypothetical protein
MRLIGFNFTKISVERLKDITENLKFNTKIDISSIEPIHSNDFKVKDEPLKINFVYSVFYEPEFAKIELAGSIILSVEAKIAKEVLKGWKDKQLTEDFRISMFNIILRKANIKALELEEEVGLPTHLPLPSLNKNSLQEKK